MPFSRIRPAAEFRPIGAAAMRRLDERAIRAYGVPGAVLMDNAGRAAADLLLAKGKRRVAVFCGGGNNGGDGLAAARHLANAGARVKVVLARPPAALSGDARVHWRPVARMRLPRIVYQGVEKLLQSLEGCDAALDALLGTGYRGPLREPYAGLVRALNLLRAPVLAMDAPSGLDADTGRPAPNGAVRARWTLTLGLPKKGLLQPRARRWTGPVSVADIGFPRDLTDPFRRSTSSRGGSASW
jgi:NAD(P)H-hydrate epimerase